MTTSHIAPVSYTVISLLGPFKRSCQFLAFYGLRAHVLRAVEFALEVSVLGFFQVREFFHSEGLRNKRIRPSNASITISTQYFGVQATGNSPLVYVVLWFCKNDKWCRIQDLGGEERKP